MLRVNLNCYGSYTTDSVFQWDLNHTLKITGLPAGQVPTVHFCNKKSDEAIVVPSSVENDSITVPVPNQLLEAPYDIIAYLHIYETNQAKTIEIINIPLIKRPKPTDYQFTENVEIETFERLEQDIADFIALMNDFKTETTNTLADYKEEMDTTLQDCRDASSVVQLQVIDVNGGDPTTGTYSNTYDGGYPT